MFYKTDGYLTTFLLAFGVFVLNYTNNELSLIYHLTLKVWNPSTIFLLAYCYWLL